MVGNCHIPRRLNWGTLVLAYSRVQRVSAASPSPLRNNSKVRAGRPVSRQGAEGDLDCLSTDTTSPPPKTGLGTCPVVRLHRLAGSTPSSPPLFSLFLDTCKT